VIGRGEIEIGAEPLAQQLRAVALVAADHPSKHLVRQRPAGLGERAFPRRLRDRLGIEHQPIHVEDHAAAGWRRETL
jgi:hypothetical protein